MLAFILHFRYLDDHRLVKFIVSIFLSFYIGYVTNCLIHSKPCPNCYGDDWCSAIQSRQIRLSFFSYVALILSPKLTKSVFYGTVNESEWIVLKRKFRRKEEQWHSPMNYFMVKYSSPQSSLFCPGFRNPDWFYKYLRISVNEKRLWLNLESSIEPLLLRYFQSTGNDLFPEYKGACGDIIVEEYKGLSLSNYPFRNFKERLDLSAKLLKFAEIITFHYPDFIFYFTDVSPDNLVVDSSGNISLADLDNIIILDRKNYPSSIIQNVHKSEIFTEYDYAFSPLDICNHYLSDHNYYSICLILTDSQHGLLKEIPKFISQTHPELITLLNECREPKVYKNRIQVVQKLQTLMGSIINNYSYFSN